VLAALVLALLAGAPGAAQAQVRDYSDHLRTGFPLTGAHERVACETCHVRGMFEGTPRECGVCHSGGGFWQATRKPPNHIPSSEKCGDCHLTTSWATARFDHSQVTGDCIRCHNGAVATGKPMNHVPSPDACELCHGTVAWVPARFDHSMVMGSCYSCHNGTFARGKPGDHPPSSNACEDCHDTRSWETSGFDHTGITTGCFSCHNGSTARGKSGNHPPSSNECEVCHTTSSWAGAGFDHTGISGGCAACHNGGTATGKPGNHIVTSLECNVCHSTAAWVPARFVHTSPNYPGDHAAPLDCSDCHVGGGETVLWQAPAYQPDCAGCHASDYRPGEHKKVDSPQILYTVSELRDCTGACHEYTDATFTTIREARSGEHRVNRGGW
jgi:hypothetical protein